MGRTRAKEGYFCLMRRSNGFYYYWTYDRFGRRIYRSTGEKTKTKAMDVALQRSREGALIDIPRPVFHLFRDYAENFWNYDTCPVIQDRVKRGGHYSVEGAESNGRLTRKHIIPYFGDRLIESITAHQVSDWILRLPEAKKLSNKSCNNILTILRQILDAAIADGIIDRNPAKAVKPLVKDGTRRGCFTLTQVKDLFKAEWEHDQARIACLLASRTGMRMGEVQALVPEQVHQDYIDVCASWANKEGRKTTKSGWSRIVPIDKDLSDLLKSIQPPKQKDFYFTLCGTQPLSKSTIEKYLKNAMTATGIDYENERLSFHSFRHFFNTRLKAASVDGGKVRAVIGHESEEMTEHYLHLTAADMEEIRAVQRGIAM